MLVYDKSTGQIAEQETIRVPESNEVAWIPLYGPDSTQVRYVLDNLFQCHPLLVEDCIKLNQRPKMDRYKNHYFISFFAVDANLTPQEIAIVIGENYVIAICRQKPAFFAEIETGFREIEGRMENSGLILYHLLDRCVDGYAEIINRIEDNVDRMERGIYKNPYMHIAQEIYRLKRSTHRIRRIFAEERTILGSISHINFPYTQQETDLYFIDIYDHISRVMDTLDIFRESLTGLMEMQMNLKSDRLNEIMKTLTIVSSFFLPLTFIVGIYGMNFSYIPELHWRYGYFVIWGLMIAASVFMWIYYKRKKWM